MIMLLRYFRDRQPIAHVKYIIYLNGKLILKIPSFYIHRSIISEKTESKLLIIWPTLKIELILHNDTMGPYQFLKESFQSPNLFIQTAIHSQSIFRTVPKKGKSFCRRNISIIIIYNILWQKVKRKGIWYFI